ncbi:hypothetical protein SD77_1551 [Bacillus badius]|uniref:Mobile element protein n=1 Tax=Bacillus badius TaxID=1455 RepID=A0ABR5ARD1_BACBA|nr:hypothetical protein SD78_4310 [Bacillus badius]KIL77308.1 hypothetical protein SD77_1551 [Bacillus badius]
MIHELNGSPYYLIKCGFFLKVVDLIQQPLYNYKKLLIFISFYK